jgi:hypothetical protein
LSLKCDLLVSHFGLKWVNLYRYNEAPPPALDPAASASVAATVMLCATAPAARNADVAAAFVSAVRVQSRSSSRGVAMREEEEEVAGGNANAATAGGGEEVGEVSDVTGTGTGTASKSRREVSPSRQRHAALASLCAAVWCAARNEDFRAELFAAGAVAGTAVTAVKFSLPIVLENTWIGDPTLEPIK